MKEITIKTYEFELLGDKIYVILESKQLDPFNVFISKLNLKEDWNESVNSLVRECVLVSRPNFKVDNHTNEWMIRSLIGFDFENILDKIREKYISIIRDRNIDDIFNI